MKGFVLTPDAVVDLMVDKLFGDLPPNPDATVLDPGCGTGAFVDGVIRWCNSHSTPLPSITGIDSDPAHVKAARARFAGVERASIRRADFLSADLPLFDYVIGNPPYVPITALTLDEREVYRRHFVTATGRFDLYLLFFEQAVRRLKPGGRLVFITPEKFLYVGTAAPLRELLARRHVQELHFVDESTFGELVTYPLITTVVERPPGAPTRVTDRAGVVTSIVLPRRPVSWLPQLRGATHRTEGPTLADAAVRISCGVATGADSVFLQRTSELDPALRRFAHPTLAGRQIGPGRTIASTHSLLVPYDNSGELIPEARLGRLAKYLAEPGRKARLLARTCVTRKPWYAFHETPPLQDLLRPKILCKDIGASPFFIADREGTLVPRHSVYYIVPRDASGLDDLAEYLNSAPAQEWLDNHCQRAAHGFIRLQSHVLKCLPVPARFVQDLQHDAFEIAAV